jgi:hypothetical protein
MSRLFVWLASQLLEVQRVAILLRFQKVPGPHPRLDPSYTNWRFSCWLLIRAETVWLPVSLFVNDSAIECDIIRTKDSFVNWKISKSLTKYLHWEESFLRSWQFLSYLISRILFYTHTTEMVFCSFFLFVPYTNPHFSTNLNQTLYTYSPSSGRSRRACMVRKYLTLFLPFWPSSYGASAESWAQHGCRRKTLPPQRCIRDSCGW